MQQVWKQRAETVLGEIERELDVALAGGGSRPELVKTRLLVQMSYGQRDVLRQAHSPEAGAGGRPVVVSLRRRTAARGRRAG